MFGKRPTKIFDLRRVKLLKPQRESSLLSAFFCNSNYKDLLSLDADAIAYLANQEGVMTRTPVKSRLILFVFTLSSLANSNSAASLPSVREVRISPNLLI